MRSSTLRALIVLGLTGCATPRPNQRVCAESKSVRCLTPLVCEVDEKRGCELCRCESPPYTPPDGGDPRPR